MVAVPSADQAEAPISLIAATLAEIVSKSPMLKGLERSTVVGIVQLLVLIIPPSLSALQLIKSFSKVLVAVYISSIYAVIGRPPSSAGSVQLI